MTVTSIQWTDVTWNPVRGCARVSPGCENCYAERQAHRFSGRDQPYEGLTVVGKHGPRWAGRARLEPSMLHAPFAWRKPRRIFVNSMSDLFHEDIADDEIAAIFGVMAMCADHTFQVLTKRPARMQRLLSQWRAEHCWRAIYRLDEALGGIVIPSVSPSCGDLRGGEWPLSNVWIGVSVEDKKRARERMPLLRATPAAVRWLSMEPLLEQVTLDWSFHLEQIDWVVVGGESGPRARPCEIDWINGVVGCCAIYEVPCFVKQLGSRPYDWPTQTERVALKLGDRKGSMMAEWPSELRIREFPRQSIRRSAL